MSEYVADEGQQQMKILVTGGARSGKSRHAEKLLTDEPNVTYLATGPRDSADPYWHDRIARHKVDRPPHWTTIETLDLAGAIHRADQPILIDSLSTWISGLIDRLQTWAEPPQFWQPKVEQEVVELARAVMSTTLPIVIVTNEIGSGITRPESTLQSYIDVLGRANQDIASAVDEVHLLVAGRVLRLGADTQE